MARKRTNLLKGWVVRCELVFLAHLLGAGCLAFANSYPSFCENPMKRENSTCYAVHPSYCENPNYRDASSLSGHPQATVIIRTLGPHEVVLDPTLPIARTRTIVMRGPVLCPTHGTAIRSILETVGPVLLLHLSFVKTRIIGIVLHVLQVGRSIAKTTNTEARSRVFRLNC